MSRRFALATLAALLVLGLAVTAVVAIVTFDPFSGTGFVGKGDVQLALGWNNAQLQSNARSLGFALLSQRRAFQDCEVTLGRITIDVTLRRRQSLNAQIQYDARTHKQVDGFNLLGYSPDQGWEGPTPVCPNFATAVGDVYYSDPFNTEMDVLYGTTSAAIWHPTP